MIMIKVGIKDCIKQAPQFKQGILNSQFVGICRVENTL